MPLFFFVVDVEDMVDVTVPVDNQERAWCQKEEMTRAASNDSTMIDDGRVTRPLTHNDGCGIEMCTSTKRDCSREVESGK